MLNLFPEKPDAQPKIYAYRDTNPQYQGLLKIGYTAQNVAVRVKQQYPTARPGNPPYEIMLEHSAMRADGTVFSDRDVHRMLIAMNLANPEGEWFECTIENVKAAIIHVRDRKTNITQRSLDFKMRPEQQEAVNKTYDYFKAYRNENPDKTVHFLWNAKMRFGKTFAAYKLAEKMAWQKILVLTFKPAVQNAWQTDLQNHIDFENWQFISPDSMAFEEADRKKPMLCFGSFQDYLGKNNAGGIKVKNEWAHAIHWDCIILDEYHFGAWRESAKELFEAEGKSETKKAEGEAREYFDEGLMPMTTDYYLYLSGTPFRAIESGEFIEEQIYNWTYSDEQKAKSEWQGQDNPYQSLPRMVMLTYQLPDEIINIAKEGEFNEFDLNVFFSAAGAGDDAKFIDEAAVQKWLNLIRGAHLETTKDNLKRGAKKPPIPFYDTRLLNILSHTFWFLPRVNSCFAMQNLLKQRQNTFYHDYKIIVAAGNKAGLGVDALAPVQQAMQDPLNSKSITLSCGKLTTGVSVKPWAGIFMLRNLTSPESYFQAAFRVQTPWAIRNIDGQSEEIIKKECYVFDFAPDRALRQIADYSCRLNVDETNPESKVREFIKFLPILAYDGSGMRELDAQGILDMAMSGTTATLLARRWESALLVNVDNNTLSRLIENQQAMDALMRIEGFRTLNQDIKVIINKAESIKKAKTEANERELTKSEKKELSDDEKEYKNLRKQVQEKLIKFATRIPIFMYLTDYREHSLEDVITQLEPSLFKRVTGIGLEDFELLVSLGVFNGQLMNDAVYKFKRYEDSSLNYTGIYKHKNSDVGLFNTVISKDDYILAS